MFEQQLNYVLSVFKNETFQIVIFIIFVISLTLYFTIFYKSNKKEYNNNYEINVFYKGKKMASKDIVL